MAFVSLRYLRRQAGLDIATREGMTAGARFSVIVVPLFAVAAVGADLLLRYPRDMNVAALDAFFFFYPVIAFVVEACLDVPPLAVLIAVFARRGIESDRMFWRLAVPVASRCLPERGRAACRSPTVGRPWFPKLGPGGPLCQRLGAQV